MGIGYRWAWNLKELEDKIETLGEIKMVFGIFKSEKSRKLQKKQ